MRKELSDILLNMPCSTMLAANLLEKQLWLCFHEVATVTFLWLEWQTCQQCGHGFHARLIQIPMHNTAHQTRDSKHLQSFRKHKSQTNTVLTLNPLTLSAGRRKGHPAWKKSCSNDSQKFTFGNGLVTDMSLMPLHTCVCLLRDSSRAIKPAT